jgi:hypothetical protein
VRHTEADRALAARHVAEGEARVESQAALVHRLAADGHESKGAQDVLDTMRITLAEFREHLAVIAADLDEPRR